MYDGKTLWKDIIPFQLKELPVSESRVIETYPELPVSLYTVLQNTAEQYSQKLAVTLSAHDADKGKARGRLPAVVDDVLHFGIQAALHQRKGHAFQ